MLPTTSLERQNLKLLLIAVDEAAEQESPCRARNEHVAVERAGIIFGSDRVAPDLVARAVVANANPDEDGDLPVLDVGWNNDGGLSWGQRTSWTEDRRDLQVSCLATFNQILRVDAQRLGDPVKPSNRDGAHARLEAPDCLRRGGWIAAPRNIVESHSACAANFADPCEHRFPLNQNGSRYILYLRLFAKHITSGSAPD